MRRSRADSTPDRAFREPRCAGRARLCRPQRRMSGKDAALGQHRAARRAVPGPHGRGGIRGTSDITAAVVSGTYQTPSLAPAATYRITASVTVKSSAAVGSKVTRLLTIASVGNGTRKDAVKLTGKRA